VLESLPRPRSVSFLCFHCPGGPYNLFLLAVGDTGAGLHSQALNHPLA